jgi:hypothetical protein
MAFGSILHCADGDQYLPKSLTTSAPTDKCLACDKPLSEHTPALEMCSTPACAGVVVGCQLCHKCNEVSRETSLRQAQQQKTANLLTP